MPALLDLDIEFVEQPVRRGAGHQLDGLQSPIPAVANESCVGQRSPRQMVKRCVGVNIMLHETSVRLWSARDPRCCWRGPVHSNSGMSLEMPDLGVVGGVDPL